MADWLWFFRGFVQWHALAIVVAELAHSTSSRFAKSAWTVLEPLLQFWDKVYETKHGDAPWDHVNSLIQRSKEASHQSEQARSLLTVARPGTLPTAPSDGDFYRAQSNLDGVANQQQYGSAHTTLRDSMPSNRATWSTTGGQDSYAGSHFQQGAANPDTAPDYACTNGLAGFDMDMGNFDFDFFPESMDLDALNAVFTSQDWQMAQPIGAFDVDAVY